jgi:lipoprotein-anchoring transpeptidase ErfK/SrfK
VSTPAGPAPGTFVDGRFHPADALEFGQVYDVAAAIVAADGRTSVHRSSFATLSPEETISAEITPEDGDTVGVGHPIIVRFSDPVPEEERAAVTARLSVESSPAVAGAWRWMSDSAVHWRPLEYWPARTNVWVAAKLAGRSAGDRWFTESTLRNFFIGEHHRITIDLTTFQAVAYAGGTPVRSMPISGGTARYPTASGIDLIMEKHDRFEMDSTSVGIYGAEAYNVTVDDAQRLTNSGTFIHAAPWNGSLGSANLSHGCINASNEDAQWMMDFTLIGDPVEIVGSDEQVSPTNGWGDWNIPAAEWAQPLG